MSVVFAQSSPPPGTMFPVPPGMQSGIAGNNGIAAPPLPMDGSPTNGIVQRLEDLADAIKRKETRDRDAATSSAESAWTVPKFDFGRLQMKSEFETSQYCRLSGYDAYDLISCEEPAVKSNIFRGDIMRFVAERVWGLKRPDLLVSVTGGAQDFSLTAMNEQELLTGVIAASREMNVWFVSGGSNSGIMKYIGDARAKYAAHVPLIAVAPWGIVNGRSHFRDPESLVQPERDRVEYKKARKNETKWSAANLTDGAGGVSEEKQQHFREMEEYCELQSRKLELEKIQPMNEEQNAKRKEELEKTKDKIKKLEQANNNKFSPPDAPKQGWPFYVPGVADMNPHHTHFFFIDKGVGRSGFGEEIELRALFEAAVTWGYSDDSVASRLSETLKQGADAQRQEQSKTSSKLRLEVEDLLARQEEEGLGRVPAVCICVQGGIGTVKTVEAACARTPVFLVKGSGNCADLCSDLVILQLSADNPMFVSPARMDNRLKALVDHLDMYGVAKRDGVWDYQEIASKLGVLENKTAADASSSSMTDHECDIISNLHLVMSQYFPVGAEKDHVPSFRGAVASASSKMCWVYDLDDDTLSKQDFSGSMLRCLINGEKKLMADKLRVDDQKTRADAGVVGVPDADLPKEVNNKLEKLQAEHRVASFKHQMHLCLRWHRPDILNHVIEHSKIKNTDAKYKQALNDMIQPALRKNHVRSLKVLVHFKADLTRMQLPFFVGQVSKDVAVDMVHSWLELLDLYESQYKVVEDADTVPRITKPSQLFKELQQFNILDQDLVSLEQKIVSFEHAVASLLGPKCRYKMGQDGPVFDLLVWSILCHRVPLSNFLWTQCDKPIHSALTGCILYRKMAKLSGLEPKVRAQMLEGGKLFENYAVGVVKLAREENLVWAMDALEERIPSWEGITAIDVAAEGECEVFLEECCAEAIERRFRGDLDPYSQKWGLFDGFLQVVFLNVLTLGLASPSVINFNTPPVAENVRFPSQRRTVPAGYPFDIFESAEHTKEIEQAVKAIKEDISTQQNRRQARRLSLETSTPGTLTRGASTPLLRQSAGQLSHTATVVKKILMDPSDRKELGPVELNTLWSNGFGYWERYWLFWRAPIVLFMASSILQLALTITFTWWLVTTRPSDRSVYPFEYLMLVYFCAYSFVEMFQFIFGGLGYLKDFWNLLDLLSSGCFIAGFIMHDLHPSAVGFLWTDSVRLEFLWLMLYSITCCCLWCRLLRVLSVEKRLGILVITIQRMFTDIFRFGIIWLFLWLAFSILMRGAALDESRWYFDHETCGPLEPLFDRRARAAGEGDDEGGFKDGVTCWRSWWLLRLFLQSMGDFHADELETDGELATLILMFIVMNIMLLNLLIAIMSNTYTHIQQEANRKYLFDMYDLSKEVSRVPLAVPAPFNVPYVLAELINFFNLEMTARSHLVYGLDKFVERLEAHFGRNQSTRGRYDYIAYRTYLEHQKGARRYLETFQGKCIARKTKKWAAQRQLPWKEDDQSAEAAPDSGTAAPAGQVLLELRRRRVVQDEAESLRDAFVERCREKFMEEYNENKGRGEQVQHLETKLLKQLEAMEDRVLDRVDQTLKAADIADDSLTRTSSAQQLEVAVGNVQDTPRPASEGAPLQPDSVAAGGETVAPSQIEWEEHARVAPSHGLLNLMVGQG